MRFNEVVCNSMSPMHILQLRHNNNEQHTSSSDLIINDKPANSQPVQQQQQQQQFHVGQDTSTYSSFAITRSNKVLERNINNNLDSSFPSSSTESLADYRGDEDDDDDDEEEDQRPQQQEDDELEEEEEEEDDQEERGEGLEEEEGSDWSEYSEDGNLPAGCRGIVNPNYPGFQHLGPSLLSDTDDTEDELEHELAPLRDDIFNNNQNDSNRADEHEHEHEKNNNNNNTLNRLDIQSEQHKQFFYEKPKFNIQTASTLMECMSYVKGVHDTLASKISDEDVQIVQLSTSVNESLQFAEIEQLAGDSCKGSETEEVEESSGLEDSLDLIREASLQSKQHQQQQHQQQHATTKLIDYSPSISTNPFLNNPFLEPLAPVDLLADCRHEQQQEQQQQQPDPVPDVVAMEPELLLLQLKSPEATKPRQQSDSSERAFDVYNIETAMPNIDMDAIEMHLKAARAEERRRRNDREEIRRRLAMGPEAQAEEARNELRRSSHKPSLQSRLQSGMNLQICFMNESVSDTDTDLQQQQQQQQASRSRSTSSCCSSASGSSSSTCSSSSSSGPSSPRRHPLSVSACDAAAERLAAADEAAARQSDASLPSEPAARQARLQTEARLALAQAKEMAHMQMEIERQKLKVSPITEMVRSSLRKIGVSLGEERRRLSRALLTELNIAQLQVLANDLHARIATLNEALVDGLLMRDDLHMEQDSMLVDVEDLTRYLGAKQQQQQQQQPAAPAKAKGKDKREDKGSARKAAIAQAQLLQRSQATTRNTLALLRAASQAKLAAQGRQLVASLVRK